MVDSLSSRASPGTGVLPRPGREGGRGGGRRTTRQPRPPRRPELAARARRPAWAKSLPEPGRGCAVASVLRCFGVSVLRSLFTHCFLSYFSYFLLSLGPVGVWH